MPKSILMVCLGNICRSPLAEGILRHKLNTHGIKATVASCGTGHWHIGEAPDPRSVAIAQKYGIDITQQRATQFHPEFLQHYDLILVMDTDNYQNIVSVAREENQQEKVRLILDYLYPGENRSVPDPYWDDDGFENVYRLLDKACDKLIDDLKTA